ncbi:MAG TPA: hypothetical protein VLF95_12840 [Vicinamibacteria bacterium]|nr:hypothetical protein [Vicinamibacteria bacterium]
MKNPAVAAAAMALALSSTLALAAPEPPTGTVSIPIGSHPLEVWPYTTGDFDRADDPVNLVFPGSDPREIRQALVGLDGIRTPTFPNVAPFNCTWTDAMGDEQAAWAETEGWVGGTVQLACVAPGAPLGKPFRFHVRLFRQGGDTLGAAHFEFLVTNTAQHEVLSWDLARSFVTLDMARTGALVAAPDSVQMVPAGFFRAVRWPIYDGLVKGGAIPILVAAGIYPSSAPAGADVPIPTSGAAAVLAAQTALAPVQATATQDTTANYSIVVPRPFCSTGPADLVLLQGPVNIALRVHTNPSGKYERRQTIDGNLVVTPMAPLPGGGFVPVGAPVRAVITEFHTAKLTDHYGQVSWSAAQVQLSDPGQALVWRLAAGQRDAYTRQESCAVP